MQSNLKFLKSWAFITSMQDLSTIYLDGHSNLMWIIVQTFCLPFAPFFCSPSASASLCSPSVFPFLLLTFLTQLLPQFIPTPTQTSHDFDSFSIPTFHKVLYFFDASSHHVSFWVACLEFLRAFQFEISHLLIVSSKIFHTFSLVVLPLEFCSFLSNPLGHI